jgi:protein ImuB
VSRLVDTLGSRLGPARVLRAHARASHVPERAFALEAAHRARPSTPPEPGPPPADRPTLLLSRPEPASVTFLHPEGPVARLRRGCGEDVGVLCCFGPERIGGEWWRSDVDGGSAGGGRDYYRLHTDDGAWLWVYRDLRSGRWFVHGEWA